MHINKFIKIYLFPSIISLSILLGGLFGFIYSDIAKGLKPLGDVFLNLIFTTIIPLIFFSISSAIARTGSLQKLTKVMSYMLLVFIFTGIIAAISSIFVVKLFPPAEGIFLHFTQQPNIAQLNFSDQMVRMFTVTDFSQLLTHNNILPLIIFSILVGFAASFIKNKKFVDFLQAGENVFMRVFSMIMYYAPIGFFAYFAVLVSELGPKIMQNYLRIAFIYYMFGIIYFIFAFSFYAYLAGKMTAIKLFWKNIFLPSVTSLATCSSAASIPANLVSTKAMKVPPAIYETVIPLGAFIHKDGSVIGGIIKIAFLFGIFHLNFSGTSVLLTALGVSLLVGTVMGAIPSGGMLGELLILAVYGFPSTVLIAVAAISIIIDPLATMLNVTGDTVAAMLITRLVEGKNWLKQKL